MDLAAADHRAGFRPGAGHRHAGGDPGRPGGAGRLSGGLMLEVRDIAAGYGAVRVIEGLSLARRRRRGHLPDGPQRRRQVDAAEGDHGAGAAVGGRDAAGRRAASTGCPPIRCRCAGIGYVPQGRRLLGELTVAENIEIGLTACAAQRRGRRARPGAGPVPAPARAAGPARADAFGRRAADAGDRPGAVPGAEGAAARRADRGAAALDDLADPRHGVGAEGAGVAVVLVEQRVEAVLELADRVAFLAGGRVAETRRGRRG